MGKLQAVRGVAGSETKNGIVAKGLRATRNDAPAGRALGLAQAAKGELGG
jgi:hypothetical protein